MLCIPTSGSLSRISFRPSQSVVWKFRSSHIHSQRSPFIGSPHHTTRHATARLEADIFSILWRVSATLLKVCARAGLTIVQSLETAAAAAHAVRIHMDVDTDVAALVSGRAAASVRRRRRRNCHHYH
jgi:hypothetical protein